MKPTTVEIAAGRVRRCTLCRGPIYHSSLVHTASWALNEDDNDERSHRYFAEALISIGGGLKLIHLRR